MVILAEPRSDGGLVATAAIGYHARIGRCEAFDQAYVSTESRRPAKHFRDHPVFEGKQRDLEIKRLRNLPQMPSYVWRVLLLIRCFLLYVKVLVVRRELFSEYDVRRWISTLM